MLSAMNASGCTHLADRLFSELSGGEKQRVVIARALAQEPKTLLLDEPTVYLDISGQLEMMDLVAELNKEKSLTIVAVLHDINLAARYCDRIALLNRGRLETLGPPDEVLNPDTILSVYGVDVAVRRDPLTHDVFVVPRSPGARGRMDGRRVHVLCGGGSGGPVMRALLESGYPVSAGVLNMLDSDYESAADLRVPIVAEVPFAQISEEMHSENLRQIDEAAVVVVAPFPVGPGNFRNLEAAMYGLEAGKQVVILASRAIPSIDFIGGKADAYIASLIAAGAERAGSVQDVLRAIKCREEVSS